MAMSRVVSHILEGIDVLFELFTRVSARLFDLLWAIVAAVCAFYIRFGHVDLSIHYQAVVLIGSLLIATASSYSNIYNSWRGRSQMVLLGRICATWSTGYVVLMGLLVMTHHAELFSRIWLGLWAAFGILGAMAFRAFIYRLLGRLRKKGINHKQVLVVGTGDSAKDAVEALKNNSWAGYDIVQMVPINGSRIDNPYEGIPVSGRNEDLAMLVRQLSVQEVWICLPLKKGDYVNQVLYDLRHSTVDIRYVPDLSDFRLLNHKATELAGMQILNLSCSPLNDLNHYVKQLEDRVLGLMILVMISPLLLLISIGVKLTSPGPVLFKQYRHGMDGKRINIYKFRSMKVHEEAANVITQATKNDNRITRFGKFLRQTSLDELPQFYNVIQGKMSIVGPRPHAVAHNEHYKEIIESYMKRHKVKPGITGWAQVNGFRGETDTVDKMKRRVEYDLFYIENWSLLFDLKIIMLTVIKGFFNKNAY